MDGLDRFVRVLRAGGVVACPTETLIGLLADARNAEAVARVVRLKGRPSGAPIGVLLPNPDAWSTVARDVPALGWALARAHWPGPLTLVSWARDDLPAPLVQGGKVGARVPGPSPALDLVRAFGGPLTATSANLSGLPPAARQEDLPAALGPSLDALDAVVPGAAPGTDPSTVVDVTEDPPRVIRQGALDIAVSPYGKA